MPNYAQQILENRFAVIRDVLDRSQVAAARDALETVFASEAEIGRQKNWHNNTYKVAYFLGIIPGRFHPVAAELTEEQKKLFGFYSVPPMYDPITHEVIKPFGSRQ